MNQQGTKHQACRCKQAYCQLTTAVPVCWLLTTVPVLELVCAMAFVSMLQALQVPRDDNGKARLMLGGWCCHCPKDGICHAAMAKHAALNRPPEMLMKPMLSKPGQKAVAESPPGDVKDCSSIASPHQRCKRVCMHNTARRAASHGCQ